MRQSIFYISGITFTIDSNVTYSVLPKSHTNTAGYCCLQKKSPHFNYHHNGVISIECRSLRTMALSAAEDKNNGVFYNVKIRINIQHLLISIRH